MLSVGSGGNSTRKVGKRPVGTASAATRVAATPSGPSALQHGIGCGAVVLTAILDHLSLPIMLVDRNFLVHYANITAQDEAENEPVLAVLERIFLGSDRKEATRLRVAIVDTCVKGTGHAVILKRGLSKPSVAVTIPFLGDGPNDRRALILVRNGVKSSHTLMNSLQELFNLSLAEAEVAIAFGSGAAINDVARDRGVKRNTLRSQLASIMERTGTHRQGELVALITKIDTLVWAILVSGSTLALSALASSQEFQIT